MATDVEYAEHDAPEDGFIDPDTHPLAGHYWSEDGESDNTVEDYGDRFMKMTMANFPDSASSVKEYRRRSFNYQQMLASKPGDFNRINQSSKRRSSRPWSAISTVPSESSARVYSNTSLMKGELGTSLQQLKIQLAEEKIYRQELQEQVAKLNHQMRKLHRHRKAKLDGATSGRSRIDQQAISDIRGEIPTHEYERLGLDLVDRLNSAQLANIVKNTILLLNVPLNKLEVFVPALARILEQEDIFMDFANKLHWEMFGESITYGDNTASTKKCFERMLDAARQFNNK